ncbi:MAG: hypothetical protein ACT4PM_09420 [Gemmatimonadales bacterium]
MTAPPPSEVRRARHLLFGYATQVASFGILAATNLLLPRFLSGSQLFTLNLALAHALLLTGTTGEAMSYQLILRTGEAKGGVPDPRLFWRTAGEYLAMLLPGILVLEALWGFAGGANGGWFWLIVALPTVLVVAFYMVVIAWLTASFRNQTVVVLALVNGALGLVVPLLLARAQGNLAWSPLLAHLGSLALALVVAGLPASALALWRPFRLEVLSWRAFPALASPAIYKQCVLWGPILFLGAGGRELDANNFRIASSLVEGALSLVPFPRTTMLTLSRGIGRLSEDARRWVATTALLVAAVGSLILTAGREPLTALLYPAEYAGVADNLRFLGPVLLIQVVAIVLVNELLAAGATGRILRSYAVAMLAAIVAIPVAATPASVPLLGAVALALAAVLALGPSIGAVGQPVFVLSVGLSASVAMAALGFPVPAASGFILVVVAFSLVRPGRRYWSMARETTQRARRG